LQLMTAEQLMGLAIDDSRAVNGTCN
jgi:hypothetical protein